MSGNTGVTPITSKHSVSLTERQVDTILNALKWDYVSTKRDFGALPVVEEELRDIMDAYQTVRTQSR